MLHDAFKTTVMFNRCHMAYIFKAQNEYTIFDIKIDKLIFDHKYACLMTFSCLKCKRALISYREKCD